MSIQVIRPDYNDPEKYYRLSDNFAGAGVSSGQLGEGWALAGTNAHNAVVYDAEAGSMSNKGIVADSALDDFSRWIMWKCDVGNIAAGLRFRIRIKPVDLATVYWHFGVVSDRSAGARPGTASEFFGFRVDTAVDGKVYGVVKSGAGTESTVDLGLATSAAWRTYELRLGSSAMSFYVDGTLTGSAPLTHLMTVAGNTPTTQMWVQNLNAGATRTVRITYLDLIAPTGY